MHTAEHILNATMVDYFNCDRCFSAHIEKRKSKCDYYLDRPIREEEIRFVEERVNEIIDRNLKLEQEMVDKKKAEKDYDLKRIPGEVSGMVRVVKVGDYDACPCVGPHVECSGDIGRFKITSYDWNNGVLRIRFKLEEN